MQLQERTPRIPVRVEDVPQMRNGADDEETPPSLPKEERDRLVKELTPLAISIARWAKTRLSQNILMDDVVAAAMVGVWETVRKYGHLPQQELVWIGKKRIWGAIVDELRRTDWLPRKLRRDMNAGTVDGPKLIFIGGESIFDRIQPISDRDQEDPSVDLDKIAALKVAVKVLNKREMTILNMALVDGVPAKIIAKKLKVSQPRISQLKMRAIEKLREAMAEWDPDPDTDPVVQ
jgi:RNA polymerase sigma factor for flagellar operon FliA